MGTTDTVTRMAIRVLLFAQLKERLGQPEFVLSLPKGSCGHDLVARLTEREPSLKPLLSVSRLAVNCDYAPFDTVLENGDEVAVISPVSGG